MTQLLKRKRETDAGRPSGTARRWGQAGWAVPPDTEAAAWAASQWIAKRLGGYTGDTLGAVQQVAEIAFLVVAALFIAR